MKVLLLGGTGAMGTPLQNYLSELEFEVFVTSRKRHQFSDNIKYYYGNAHDESFIKEVLKNHFDVIVDFMAYSTEEFTDRAELLMSNTAQYIFISSARVYAPSSEPIKEEHVRLLDICKDSEYLKTDEYALSKARQENVLLKSGNKNYTIVRPSLTYNSERLQYALGEKELWLYRFLHNEKIIFPESMESITNTMSYGGDVAKAISFLVGNKKALSEVVHIAGADAISWGEVNKIYFEVLKKRFKRDPELVRVDGWEKIGLFMGTYYQLKYARSIDRRFDNSKLESIVGNIDFISPEEGLKKCLNAFLDGDKTFLGIDWRKEAYFNRITGDIGFIDDFSFKNKVKYAIGRYTPCFGINPNL